MSQHEEFNKEKAYLKAVCEKISGMLGKLETISIEAKKRVRELYDTYTLEDSGYYLEIPMAEDLSLMAEMDFFQWVRAADRPYFGKIIFIEDTGEQALLYVGKKSFLSRNDKEEQLPIIDWRAPVAQIYYDARLGPSKYTSPMGSLEVDLKLKRTLKIKKAELQDIYDLDVVADDDLLLDYLSQNKDVVLGEIVATIQQDQNRIIRKTPKRNLVVQGVAGSGKTTVLLHRISYLLYNYKELLNYRNLCLIAANPLFLNYITSMLPDLDVPIIKQSTMDGILLDIMSGYDRRISYSAVQTGNPPYRNDAFPGVYRKYVSSIGDRVFLEEEVSLFGIRLLSAERIREIKNRETLRLHQKASELDETIGNEIKKNREYMLSYMSKNRYDAEVVKAADIMGVPPENLFEAVAEKRFSRLSQHYAGTFRKRLKRHNPKAAFGELTGVSGNLLTVNDLACYLLLFNELSGVSFTEEIRHIVIDEAQDFGMVVYLCLKTLFSGASFSLAGDIMQNINTYGLQNWKELLDIFPDADFENLYKSYRNTIEISCFAKKVTERLTGTGFYVEPIVRHGEPVRLHPYAGFRQKLERLGEILASFPKESLTAVICRTGKEAKQLFEKAGESCDLMLLRTSDASLKKGVYVMPVENAKGLEFDSVVLWDFDDFAEEEYKALYVASTRALHRLHVFTNNPHITDDEVTEKAAVPISQ